MELNQTSTASVDTICDMLSNLNAFAELDLETMFGKFKQEGSDEI